MARLDDAERLLVEQNVDVAQINARMWIKRAAWLIEPDELRAIAYLALCEAACKWSPDGGASFRSFAFYGIRAAIVQEIRRRVGRVGRNPEVHRRVYVSQLASLERLVDEHGFQHGDDDPAIAAVESDEFVDVALASLPERERFALAMRLFEDLSLVEIGELLGVSESRASQLIGRGLRMLRDPEHRGSIASLA